MKNKVILITGGASGIGLATAKKLAKENKVIIADYKNIEQDFIKIILINLKMLIFLNAIYLKKMIF